MSLCPVADAMENGLLSIINELMGEVWVDCGKGIPAFNIWQDDRAIEVIPISRERDTYKIDIRVGKKEMSFSWDANRAIGGQRGFDSYTFADCDRDELAIAGGLMLMYFGQAMTEGETTI